MHDLFPDAPPHFVHAARSPLAAVLATATRVAASGAHAIVYGASGTGKEALARLIHARGPGAALAFVAVSCGGAESDAIAEALSPAEGGAAERPPGTVYLDDVGELPLAAQARLVRALDGRAAVRVVAGSTRDLNGDVAAGRFRRDLFDLLACPLYVPLLRDRRDDVLAIFERCWAGLRPGSTASPEARALLSSYAWPGNVREVLAVSQRLAALQAGREISRRDVERALLAGTLEGAWVAEPDAPPQREPPDAIRPDLAALGIPPGGSAAGVDLNAVVRRVESDLIRWALDRSRGCKSTAAALLGLRRTTFTEKLKKVSQDAACVAPVPGRGDDRSGHAPVVANGSQR